jgi:riboflavin biosynthesis pyrimidine reductase
VLADDPRLDVRHVPHDGPQPRPVVFDTHARTPMDATVVARGALVVVTSSAPTDRTDALAAAGAEVVVVDSVDGHVDPVAGLDALAERGIAEVYAEPGAALSAALVRHGLVDELLLHRGGGIAAGWPAAWEVGAWRVVRSRPLGDDREIVARPA